MKILFNVGQLLPQIAACASVANTKNAIPILDCVKLSVNADAKKMSITSSDADTWFETTCEIIDADENFQVCVETSVVLRTLQSLSQDTNVTMDVRSKVAMFSYNTGHFSIPFYDAKEFPVLPNDNDGLQFVVNADDINDAIVHTLFAIGVDVIRPILGSVRFDFKENQIVAAATDTSKLVRYINKVQQYFSSPIGFTLPSKPANVIKSMSAVQQITITLSDKRVSFNCDSFNMSTKLIEGNYPNYESVIPPTSTINVSINRQNVLDAIRRVSIMGDNQSKEIKLKISSSSVYIKAQDEAIGKSGEELVECTSDVRGTFDISFISNHLIDVLKNITTDNVIMMFNAPDRAMVATVHESDKVECTYLLMPLRQL